MALTLADIIVAGPTRIQVNLNGTDWEDFGECDNDNMPQWIDRDIIHEVKTSSSGAAPEQLVHQGIVATVSCVMVKWDITVLASLKAQFRGGAANVAVVGNVLAADTLANSLTFGVRILPYLAGNPGVDFPRCYVNGDSFINSQWGNVEQRLAFSPLVMPDPSTGVLWNLVANS